ncbi:MAG TPA: hypothetical protein VKV17_12055 [Bryobacteraceae bacterium]|nr:hypothetical protein [Bryobacteraceae bacterium]
MTSFSYTAPVIRGLQMGNGAEKALSWLFRDWTLSGVLKYASGILIRSPSSNITLWNKTLVLNPNAWSNQTTETFGDAAPYYGNCRWQRQPAESLGNSGSSSAASSAVY